MLKKKKSRFFESFIQQYGKDFLLSANADSLKNRSNMFFKDLAFGSVDKMAYGQYFYDRRFMDVMINEAFNKMYETNMHYTALQTMANVYPNMIDEKLQFLMRKDYSAFQAYSYIYSGLTALASNGDLVMLDWISTNINSSELKRSI